MQVKALNSYTVCVCRQGSKKLQFATALTVATSQQAAVDRVIRLYAGDDPLLLERDLVAIDAYSDTSLQLLQADGFDNVDEALAVFMRIEGGILLRARPERTKVRTPRETVASVRKGTAGRSKAAVAATVEKLNRAPIRATASDYAAEVFERVNGGSRPAVLPVAKRKAVVAKRVVAPTKPKAKPAAKPAKKLKRS